MTGRKLDHVAIQSGPLKNVLLAHNVRIDEQVSISNTEVFLTGGTFEAFEVVDFVTDTHCHFKGPDPLFTRSTEPILTEKPEVVSPTQLPAKFVVKPAAHLPQAAAAEVTAEAILMPVLLDSLEEETVPDALLTPAARQE